MTERQDEILDSVPLVTEAELRLFGSRIVKSRTKKGWKQRELARRTGIEPSRLSRLERGAGIAKLEELARLRTALGSSVDELLFGAGPSAEAALGRLAGDLAQLDKLYEIIATLRQVLELLSHRCSSVVESPETPVAVEGQP